MRRADDIASVVLARSGPWTDAMQLQKLLYYVQAWHLAVTDEPLFAEGIEAWKDGPVVREVWRARKEQSTRRSVNQDIDAIRLDPFASDLIDLVIARYGSMSGDELSALTHLEQPWREARGGLPDGVPCHELISTASMAKFYRAHRQLGNRTAADLAAGGVHPGSGHEQGPVNVDEILAGLPEECEDPGEDRWGGASLDSGSQYDDSGIVRDHQRAYLDT